MRDHKQDIIAICNQFEKENPDIKSEFDFDPVIVKIKNYMLENVPNEMLEDVTLKAIFFICEIAFRAGQKESAPAFLYDNTRNYVAKSFRDYSSYITGAKKKATTYMRFVNFIDNKGANPVKTIAPESIIEMLDYFDKFLNYLSSEDAKVIFERRLKEYLQQSSLEFYGTKINYEKIVKVINLLAYNGIYLSDNTKTVILSYLPADVQAELEDKFYAE